MEIGIDTMAPPLQFAQLFDAVSNLSRIPIEEWQAFEKHITAVKLDKGAVFQGIDEYPGRAAFVITGLMRGFYVSREGDELVRNFSGPGGFLGDYSSFILDEKTSMVLEALEATTVCAFYYKDFAAFLPRHMCWQEIGRKIAEKYYVIRERHARDLLMLSAGDRFEAFRKSYPYFASKVPQKQIALYLGINPVSLSRLRAQKKNAT